MLINKFKNFTLIWFISVYISASLELNESNVNLIRKPRTSFGIRKSILLIVKNDVDFDYPFHENMNFTFLIIDEYFISANSQFLKELFYNQNRNDFIYVIFQKKCKTKIVECGEWMKIANIKVTQSKPNKLVIAYRNIKPFFVMEDKPFGIEWAIVKTLAEKNNFWIKWDNCLVGNFTNIVNCSEYVNYQIYQTKSGKINK